MGHEIDERSMPHDVLALVKEINRIVEPFQISLSLDSRDSFVKFHADLISLVLDRKLPVRDLNAINRMVSRILDRYEIPR
jgi:hypothetical protein